MHEVRLRCVHGLAVVPHVLRRMERLERQAVEEVPWMHQPSHRSYLPTSPRLQDLGQALELRYDVRPKAEHWEAVVEFATGERWVLCREVLQSNAPGLDLLW